MRPPLPTRFAEDGVAEGMGEPIHGPKAFEVLHASFLGAFDGLKLEIRDRVESGNRVAVRVHATGTHNKTGKAVEFEGVGIVDVVDGRITRGWNCFDFHTMLVQCEHVESEAFARAMTP